MSELPPKANLDHSGPIPALANITPIGMPEGQLIRGIDDLEQYVEGPALPACQDLFDKNILTVSSSANSENGLYIDIDYATLSDENRQIADTIGTPIHVTEDGTYKTIKITVNAEEAEDEETVAAGLASVAGQFKKQRLNWAPTYTLPEIKQIYGYQEDEHVPIKDFREIGYYFDHETERFHVSEELFLKSKENPFINKDEPVTFQGDQLLVLQNFVSGTADHGQPGNFASTVESNNRKAMEGEYDPRAGEIAITAAALGATARSRPHFEINQSSLREKICTAAGLEGEDKNIFNHVVTQVAKNPHDTPLAVRQLASVTNYAKLQEKNGADPSGLRIAALSYVLAATQDTYLRHEIFTGLRSMAKQENQA